MTKRKPHILLTNDDGIRSPGLWAAAGELSKIGYVTVAAPREQSSGMGRSLPNTSSGIIKKEQVKVNGQTWDVYAVGGTPAQAVLHGVLEIVPHEPDLIVSGINYGENVGLGVTISGTVGAAMEAAGLGYRALAVSLETDPHLHLSHSEDVDFSAAAYFTSYFARILLERKTFDGVDLLKVEVPRHATPETEWRLSRLSLLRYYKPTPTKRKSWDEPGPIGYEHDNNLPHEEEGTDVEVLRIKKMVAVTPICLDMTARVDFKKYEQYLRD
ncbi:MAG: 5'/3'-nucleotidase SurE [Anaerolineales bacterium]|nr:5'/3'-nucleotidase SurE [Anaerolineales bacterium]MCK6581938.1 5'/3'-nucleotidase SurE [Anaerolineales bacterium]GJQ35314.1 MAG: 5'/3'-nucleotidase SurE [Anaerolineaceae bacterium]